jgi:hypothetical protein
MEIKNKMSLKPRKTKKTKNIRLSSLEEIDRWQRDQHQRISSKGDYILKTGKRISVSPDYVPNWTLLKEQPDEKFHRKKMKDYLYHGTSDVHLDSIKKYGLMISDFPGMGAVSSSAWEGPASDMIGNVGLTDWISNAAAYTLHATLLAEKRGNQLIIVVDKSKLNPELLYIRHGSGAPPAKEWDYKTEIPPSAIVGYWQNIGKVKIGHDGRAYVEESPKDKHHKGWVYYDNPRYGGNLI